ncbi:hypothetical protein APSETT444_004008 [Aspergillus pseudonomiae]
MPPKSKSKKDIAPPKQRQQQQTPKPNWPPLRPLIPSSDLTLDPLLPDQIYLIPNFFTANLCKTYVSFLSSLPLTTTPGKPKKGDAVRVNDRFQIQDERFAESLWSGTALKDLVMNGNGEEERSMKEIWGGEPLGLNANIRIYRYSKGQFFAQHLAPVTGMALLHRHGDRCLLHEGSEVSDGEKWVLRSDLVVR